jgi:hypothetical protein
MQIPYFMEMAFQNELPRLQPVHNEGAQRQAKRRAGYFNDNKRAYVRVRLSDVLNGGAARAASACAKHSASRRHTTACVAS